MLTLTFPLTAPHNLHLLSDLHAFSWQPFIHISPFATLHPPAAPQTHNKHWIPPHPAPMRPGAGGGSGARVQTGVDRKWLFSLAPRSWPQHPSTFHFSHLSRSGHVAQDGSVTFTLRLALFVTTCNTPVNQCSNVCFSLNYISVTSEDWRVNSYHRALWGTTWVHFYFYLSWKNKTNKH